MNSVMRYFMIAAICLTAMAASFSQALSGPGTYALECYVQDIIDSQDCDICNKPGDREIFTGIIAQRIDTVADSPAVVLDTQRIKIYYPYTIKIRPQDVLIYDQRAHSVFFNFGQTEQFADSAEFVAWLKLCHFPDTFDTDSQSINLVNDTLRITRGNYVVLTPYLDDTDTDSQSVSIFNDTLYITRGNYVDLKPYLDDRDTQKITQFYRNGDTVFIQITNDVLKYLIIPQVMDHDEQKIDTFYISIDDSLHVKIQNDPRKWAVDLSPYLDDTDTDDQTIDTMYFQMDSLYIKLEGDPTTWAVYIEPTSLISADKQKFDTLWIVNDTAWFSIQRDSVPAIPLNLKPYLDNTDSQRINLFYRNIDTIFIRIDNDTTRFLILPEYIDADTDSQSLYLVNDTLHITRGNSVIIMDNQVIDTFDIVANLLRISLEGDNGPFKWVDLTPYLDNTDNQYLDTFVIVGNKLRASIFGDGLPFSEVDLAPYLNNQNLSFSGTSSPVRLNIDGGGTDVDFAAGTNITLSQAAQVMTINAIPASPDKSIQFNDGGVFGGDSYFLFDKTTNRVSINQNTVGNGLVNITTANEDYTNTAGAGTIFNVNNSSASGQIVSTYYINGILQGKTRFDYGGNLTWASGANSASTGHLFFVNGDYPTGEVIGKFTNAGAIFSNGSPDITSASATQAVDVRGNIAVTGAYYDSSNDPGSSGQVLSSTVTGTNWINATVDTDDQTLSHNTVTNALSISEGNTISTLEWNYYNSSGQVSPSPSDNVLRPGRVTIGWNGSIGPSIETDAQLRVFNESRIDWLSFITSKPVFGQRFFEVHELSDVLYLASKRYKVFVNGAEQPSSAFMFDGNFDAPAYQLPNANTTNTIEIDFTQGLEKLGPLGISYSQGYLYVSYYFTAYNYTSIKVETRHNGTWVDITSTLKNITTNSSFVVQRFTVPFSSNYLQQIRFTYGVPADPTTLWISEIDYTLTRMTTETEEPYLTKFLDNKLHTKLTLRDRLADRQGDVGTMNQILVSKVDSVNWEDASTFWDHDFYAVGTFAPPTAITQNQWTKGFVGINDSIPAVTLDISGQVYIQNKADTFTRLTYLHDTSRTGLYPFRYQTKYASTNYLNTFTSEKGSIEFVQYDTARAGFEFNIAGTSSGKPLYVQEDTAYTVALRGLNESRIDHYGYNTISPVYGQRRQEQNELADILYKADLRFLIKTTDSIDANGDGMGGILDDSVFFDNNFETGYLFDANDSTIFNIHIHDTSGYGASGVLLPEGYIYLSFNTNKFDDFSNRDTIYLHAVQNGVTQNITGTRTDISMNTTNRVYRYKVDNTPNLTNIRLTVVSKTNDINISSINYLPFRVHGERPYLNKYTDNTLVTGLGLRSYLKDRQNQKGLPGQILVSKTDSVEWATVVGATISGDTLSIGADRDWLNIAGEVSYDINEAIYTKNYVGINDTTPDTELDVFGNVDISNRYQSTETELNMNWDQTSAASTHIYHIDFWRGSGDNYSNTGNLMGHIDYRLFGMDNIATSYSQFVFSTKIGVNLHTPLVLHGDTAIVRNIQISQALFDRLGLPGTSGQVLTSTVTGVQWQSPTVYGTMSNWFLNGVDDAFGSTQIDQAETVAFDGINGIQAGLVTSGSNTLQIDGALLQWTVAASTGTAQVIGNAASPETVTFAGAGIVSTSISGNTVTITANEVDASTTNELQYLFWSASLPTTVTLNLFNSPGTNPTITAGAGLSFSAASSTNVTLIAADNSATNELDTWDLGANGSYTNISNGEQVNFVGAGITSVTRSGNQITITSSEIDASVTNEIQGLDFSGTSGTVTMFASGSVNGAAFTAGPGITLGQGSDVLTISAVDQSATNEIQGLSYVGTSGTITLDLSGTTSDVTFVAGSNITLSATGTALTINATGTYNWLLNGNNDIFGSTTISSGNTVTVNGVNGILAHLAASGSTTLNIDGIQLQWVLAANSGTSQTIGNAASSETVTIAGVNQINTSISSNTVSVGLDLNGCANCVTYINSSNTDLITTDAPFFYQYDEGFGVLNVPMINLTSTNPGSNATQLNIAANGDERVFISSIETLSGSFTMSLTNLYHRVTGVSTITLPSAVNVPVVHYILNDGGSSITLNRSSTNTINGTTSITSTDRFIVLANSGNGQWVATVSGSGGGSLTGSGTNNFVAKWTGSTSLGDSQIQDNGSTAGVGGLDASYKFFVSTGNMKVGNASGGLNKMYFGDGTFVFVGEHVTDDRLYLNGNTLSVNIGGSLGSSGQVLTSNGTTVSWANNDNSTTNEIQSLAFSGGSSPVSLGISGGGTGVNFIAGTNITLSQSGSNLTINASGGGGSYNLSTSGSNTTTLIGSGTSVQFLGGSGVSVAFGGTSGAATLTFSATDASTTNELQNLSFSGGTTPSLNISGGSGVTFSGGTGVSLFGTGSSMSISVADNSATNEIDNLTFSGSGPVTLNSSGGTDVTFTAGSGISFSAVSSTNITLAATDNSITNEAQTWSNTGTSSFYQGTLSAANGAGGGTITFQGGSGVTVGYSAGVVTISSTAAGTVTSVGLLPPSAGGITVSGSPITSSGNIQLQLTGDLLGLEQMSSNGLVARSSGVFIGRTITAGSGISVSNGDGTTGNPTISVQNLTGLQTGLTASQVMYVGSDGTPEGDANFTYNTTSDKLILGSSVPMQFTGHSGCGGCMMYIDGSGNVQFANLVTSDGSVIRGDFEMFLTGGTTYTPLYAFRGDGLISSYFAGTMYQTLSSSATLNATTIYANGTTSGITINLGTATPGRIVHISNHAGAAITVAPPSGTINGAANISIASAKGGIFFCITATTWSYYGG